MKSELVPHMSGEVLTESKSMNKPLLNSQAVLPHWEPKYPFDLVVAYEDLATRNRALLLYDHLSEQLIDEYDFQCTWWKLDHLCSQTLREQAADAAAGANMIMLSLSTGQALSSVAKSWVETWLSRKEIRKSALVLLIDQPRAPGHAVFPVEGYLQTIARLAKMDFFCHPAETPANDRAYSVETIAQRAGKVTPVLEEILTHKWTAPRWGLNE